MVVRRRTASNGMELLAVGDGPRTILVLPGGPGSVLPTRLETALGARSTRPYRDAGLTVWTATRRRGMPAGHTVADMADDYADLIRTELGGRVDVAVGISYGGMVAQHLAARHPDVLAHLALVGAAATVTPWGSDVDRRFAEALDAGRDGEAGAAFLEYALPGGRRRRLRRVLGPVVGLALAAARYPRRDALVESIAERGFDARPVLPAITAPTLLVAGDEDLFFSRDAVTETARLIPDCRLVRYPGLGHLRAVSSPRVPRDVVAFLRDTGTTTPPPPTV